MLRNAIVHVRLLAIVVVTVIALVTLRYSAMATAGHYGSHGHAVADAV